MCERCACFKLERMNKEEIEKQIEAVRGLIVIKSILPLAISELPKGAYIGELKKIEENLTKHLRTLTQTLQPYLNGEKLEV